MSSSVIESPASLQVHAAVARVELLLAADTADEAVTEYGRVADACGLGAIGPPGDGAIVPSGVPADTAPSAADLGGLLRHVAVIEWRDGVARAWRDLAVVPHGHLLAGVKAGHAAVVIRPVSGPAVLLAASSPWPEEVLTLVTRLAGTAASPVTAAPGADPWPAPASPAWMVGLAFPHALPPAAFVGQLLAGAGVPVRRLVLPPDSRPASRCWAELHPAPRADVARALAALHRVHRVVGQSWLVL